MHFVLLYSRCVISVIFFFSFFFLHSFLFSFFFFPFSIEFFFWPDPSRFTKIISYLIQYRNVIDWDTSRNQMYVFIFEFALGIFYLFCCFPRCFCLFSDFFFSRLHAIVQRRRCVSNAGNGNCHRS